MPDSLWGGMPVPEEICCAGLWLVHLGDVLFIRCIYSGEPPVTAFWRCSCERSGDNKWSCDIGDAHKQWDVDLIAGSDHLHRSCIPKRKTKEDGELG